MAGVYQNTSPGGVLTMNDPKFKNWLKAAYGFRYLKSGLEGFVSTQIGQRYSAVKQQVFQQCQQCSVLNQTVCPHVQPCSVCTTRNLLPDHGANGCRKRDCFCSQRHRNRRKCPNNFCSVFYDLIVDDHVYNTPRWSSTDISTWFHDSIQYAKCFIGTDSPATSIGELDCTGLLSIVIHNSHIHNSINDVNLFTKCRKDRNTIFHTGNYQVTDQDLNGYILDMINALEDANTLINDPAAMAYVARLNELKNNQITITDVDFVKLVQDSLAAINDLGETVKQDIEVKRKHFLQEFDQRYADAIRDIKKETEKLTDQAAGEIDKHAKDGVRQLSEHTDKNVCKIDEHLKDGVRQLNEHTDKNVCKIDEHLKDGVRQLNEHTDNNVSKIDENLKGGVRKLREHTDQNVSKIDEHLEDGVRLVRKRADENVSKVDKNTNDGVRLLSERTVENIRTIDKHTNDGVRILSERTNKIFGKIDDRTNNAAREINEKKDEAIRNIEQASKSTGISIEETRSRLVNIYKKYSGTLPVSPLYDEDEDEMNLLSIYKPPSLYHVPYLRTQEKEERYPISSFNELFCKYERSFRKLYVTGDAGVGKTSFCKRMSLLWCMSKSGERSSDKGVQADIDFISQFDFVFHVSLRDTQKKDIVAIILEQLFSCEYDRKPDAKSISNILSKYKCIIIMDALDEWIPSEKINIDILYADKCTLVTTCRPYTLENERLTDREIDRHVQMTGTSEKSTKQYVSEIVNRMNKANGENKDPVDFMIEVEKCRLSDQICIPIIASHLIAVWFEHKLTNMSRALLYSNIVDMLLNRAEKTKHIKLPDSQPESTAQFPESLLELFYLNRYGALLKKIGLLSFNILFRQDKCLSDVVFTTEQLGSKPYFVHVTDIDFLCKFGILSKHKIIGRWGGKRVQKLTYTHKTYLEYFAALFVASFDSNSAFDDVVKNWHSVDDVVRYETFFFFLVGFSCEKSETVFHGISHSISDNMKRLWRIVVSLPNLFSFQNAVNSLQNMVKRCFEEVKQSHNANMSLKLEYFCFGGFYVTCTYGFDGSCGRLGDDEYDGRSAASDYDTNLLKELLLLNKTCVRSLKVEGGYFKELDDVQGLQCLYIQDASLGDIHDDGSYGRFNEFTTLMLNNASTLNNVCVEGRCTGRMNIPVRSLHLLTSLYLCQSSMLNKDLHNLVEYLSNNVNMETIVLIDVTVDDVDLRLSNEHSVTLSLLNHAKLSKLCLMDVPIICHNVNISSLKAIVLKPVSKELVKCYLDLFNCIAGSQIEYLHIHGQYVLDDCTLNTLMDVVNTMPCIKDLELTHITWTDDMFLHIHPGVEHVDLRLCDVDMSSKVFHYVIDSIVHNKCVIEVILSGCRITSGRYTNGEQSMEDESVKYMYDYLATKPTIKITENYSDKLVFIYRPL